MESGRLIPITRTTYTVVDRGVVTDAQADVSPYGCAYAIPDETLIGSGEKWIACSVPAGFVRRHLAGVDLTHIELTMRWLANPASRYIIGAHLDVVLKNDEPLTVIVTYFQPVRVASGDDIAIPFHGVIALELQPGDHSVPFAGAIDSSGGGSFTVGQL